MTRLSVNINKIATLRNSRGGHNPNLIVAAKRIEDFGADGITVHPRPDERHIRYEDVYQLKEVLKTEFNIEGNPFEKKFVELVLNTKPQQVTLVPDTLNQLTSNHGWDTYIHQDFLINITQIFKSQGIRVSLFIDPDPHYLKPLSVIKPDRIELYTYNYAHQFEKDKDWAIKDYIQTAQEAHKMGLGINAGHDLDLQNLSFFCESIPYLAEVSIGHALICDALYYGLENVVQMYQRALKK
ncbi:MAG: pyridoxine 5'-phosphate synthase [Alphaproteobacteria bacterium]|nr:pyridoxine 5'-phosphate synthase [Alphaproteobacteria bacterium]